MIRCFRPWVYILYRLIVRVRARVRKKPKMTRTSRYAKYIRKYALKIGTYRTLHGKGIGREWDG